MMHCSTPALLLVLPPRVADPKLDRVQLKLAEPNVHEQRDAVSELVSESKPQLQPLRLWLDNYGRVSQHDQHAYEQRFRHR
jgi:hypothetical protein